MQTINFCRATRVRYALELKLAKRVIRTENLQKQRDEVRRNKALAEISARLVKVPAASTVGGSPTP